MKRKLENPENDRPRKILHYTLENYTPKTGDIRQKFLEGVENNQLETVQNAINQDNIESFLSIPDIQRAIIKHCQKDGDIAIFKLLAGMQGVGLNEIIPDLYTLGTLEAIKALHSSFGSSYGFGTPFVYVQLEHAIANPDINVVKYLVGFIEDTELFEVLYYYAVKKNNIALMNFFISLKGIDYKNAVIVAVTDLAWDHNRGNLISTPTTLIPLMIKHSKYDEDVSTIMINFFKDERITSIVKETFKNKRIIDEFKNNLTDQMIAKFGFFFSAVPPLDGMKDAACYIAQKVTELTFPPETLNKFNP